MPHTLVSKSTIKMSNGSPERDLDLETTIELCPNSSPCKVRELKGLPYCTLNLAQSCQTYKWIIAHNWYANGIHY